MHRAEVAASYDNRADEYVAMLGSVEQLAEADRLTIERWASSVHGRLLDAGCGPGHWSALLADRGRAVLGVDASPRFVTSARRRFAGVDFLVGDLAALPLPDGAVGGVLAWFSVIHTPPESLPGVLAELARVLSPSGSLLLGFFDGAAGAPFDHAVTQAYRWSTDALATRLSEHGLLVVESATRHDPGVRPQGHLVARRA